MNPILRLVEDVFSDGGELSLTAAPRMIFVVHGSVDIAGASTGDGDAWHGESAVSIRAGRTGATCWRFEFSIAQRDAAAQGRNVASHTKLAAPLETLPPGALLLRGDSVAFPPGGCAYLHRHQGPGIRCLLEGGIRIDTHGRSTSYGPGCAWFESGPEPVFAQAALDRPSRFIRVMVLPQTLIGKSSIQYVNEADQAKPKLQTYKVFTDMPMALPTRA